MIDQTNAVRDTERRGDAGPEHAEDEGGARHVQSRLWGIGAHHTIVPAPVVLQDWEPESHDGYCFECHLPGDVLECESCYRVFHLRCLAEDSRPRDGAPHWQCAVCKVGLRCPSVCLPACLPASLQLTADVFCVCPAKSQKSDRAPLSSRDVVHVTVRLHSLCRMCRNN